MTESAGSNRLTLVEPRSTWVITSKTSPMNPIAPLDQVYTHPWSTLGQRHGQTLLKHWCRRMSSGTFAVVSKFHLNTSKSTNMKVVQFIEGHNFHVDWNFKFWVEIGGKLGKLSASPVHRNMVTFKVWQRFVQNPLRKILYGLCESCKGWWDLQLSYSPLCALLFKLFEKISVKRCQSDTGKLTWRPPPPAFEPTGRIPRPLFP
jgi:hypothetical protein